MQDRSIDKSRILQGSLLLAALALAGCATSPRVEIQAVKMPVACREATPDRPSMPTEALAENADPFDLLRAALAEIDQRGGYEVKLVPALENCKRPVISPTPPALPGQGVSETTTR
ncbi:hypothetical protein KHY18_10975 [Acidovorax sp. CCYZU-2555]|nr:hypothetical protein [Acidovorax sp. CCYZU-2555]MBS7778517.1 hypothetical protein [Acidovorax sp. CCYZU-2555]